MFSRLANHRLHPFAKWGTYALLLLAPGSFLVLPVLWLIKRHAASRLPA